MRARVADALRRNRGQDDPDEDDDDRDDDSPGEADARLQEKALKTRTIMVSESISDELARRVYMQLLILEAESKEKPITVVINSPGGEADSGFGILDMLQFVAPPIRTLVSGLCASAAVMVFLAGEKGQRLSLPHSRFMMHQPSSQSFGQASDLEIASTEIVRMRRRYNQVVADAVGKDLETVTRDVDRDFWLTAEDARAYGLVDRVVTRRAEIES
ncbi:MAG: ATP-dependent Clp protease proteolytic subunit [Candidatus Eisenbacteria bacterium]|nr:ATP-dependent Clp protease proteolytic subunit [Candidatus Eisenbacteria bacterium]